MNPWLKYALIGVGGFVLYKLLFSSRTVMPGGGVVLGPPGTFAPGGVSVIPPFLARSATFTASTAPGGQASNLPPCSLVPSYQVNPGVNCLGGIGAL